MKISGSDNHTEVYQYQFQFHFVYSQPIRIEADCTSTVRLSKKLPETAMVHILPQRGTKFDHVISARYQRAASSENAVSG
jgi:hypothetical protein